MQGGACSSSGTDRGSAGTASPAGGLCSLPELGRSAAGVRGRCGGCAAGQCQPCMRCRSRCCPVRIAGTATAGQSRELVVQASCVRLLSVHRLRLWCSPRLASAGCIAEFSCRLPQFMRCELCAGPGLQSPAGTALAPGCTFAPPGICALLRWAPCLPCWLVLRCCQQPARCAVHCFGATTCFRVVQAAAAYLKLPHQGVQCQSQSLQCDSLVLVDAE